MIIDMKAARLKDLANKQLNMVFRELVRVVVSNYPEFLDRCYILNTPMFFQDYWEAELKPHIPQSTSRKVLFTGESKHPELLARVEPCSLPEQYGGTCRCKASCLYSGKGPWPHIENMVNFQNRE